jgi:hypothetical protein
MMDFDTFEKLCEQKKNEATDKQTRKCFTDIRKAFNAYGKVDTSYLNLDISTLFTNIEEYYEKGLKANLSPVTVNMYMRHIHDALNEDIVKNYVNSEILEKAKPIISSYIKAIYKKETPLDIGEIVSEDKNKKPTVSFNINAAVDAAVDVNDVVSSNDVSESESEKESEEDSDTGEEYAERYWFASLEAENKMLHGEVKWLRELVMHMVTR